MTLIAAPSSWLVLTLLSPLDRVNDSNRHAALLIFFYFKAPPEQACPCAQAMHTQPLALLDTFEIEADAIVADREAMVSIDAGQINLQMTGLAVLDLKSWRAMD